MARVYVPIKNPKNTLFLVKLQGGGRLPVALTGQFTSAHVAQAAIDTYQEGIRNAKS